MKKIIDDERLIYKCCHFYYKDGLGQKEISDRLGISRTTVSRLLQAGKEKGIVKIDVINVYGSMYDDLERKLEDRLHLKEVLIIDENEFETQFEHQERVNEEALKYLSRIFRDKDYIGVSMGRTLFNIANSKELVDERDAIFVPVVGGVGYGQSNEGFHANDIAAAFAKKFGGSSIPFYAPAMFNNRDIMKGFLEERSIRKVTDLFAKLHTVVMGIGCTDRDGTLSQSGYLTPEELQEFSKKGVVGDCLLKLVDADGNEEAFSDFNDRVMGLSKEQLVKIPNRVGIAVGRNKSQAVLGVIRSQKVNILITDVSCVQKMIEILDKEGSTKCQPN